MEEKIREYLRNPNTYFIGMPILAALAALYIWGMALPTAQAKVAREQEEYQDSKPVILEILKLDDERLAYQQNQDGSDEFDYMTTISQFARAYKISPSNYTVQVQPTTRAGSKKIKTASMTIRKIDVETLSQFLSGMLFRWPDMQCEQIRLSDDSSGPDVWKADLKFKYYF